MIHPNEENAFQQIDAMVFSSGALELEDYRDRLRYFLERWAEALGSEEEAALNRCNVAHNLFEAEHTHLPRLSDGFDYSDPEVQRLWKEWLSSNYSGNYYRIQ